jgi:uncharacterized membrane protein YqgA involved in biofilm formation
MMGTIINVIAILIGGVIGLVFGARIPERVKGTVVSGMGLFTAVVGIQMFLKTENALIVLGSILIGALLGEWWRIEDGLEAFGRVLEKRFYRADSDDPAASATERGRFVLGFMTASLLYCIGPMAILGSIQDGLTGNYQTLAIKSVLDGFASVAFASTLGVGVLFSIIPLVIYQGGISLLAGQLNAVVTPAMMDEMTATGGVILLGLAISRLLEIKQIRVGNFLPALAVAPFIVWVLGLFK